MRRARGGHAGIRSPATAAFLMGVILLGVGARETGAGHEVRPQRRDGDALPIAVVGGRASFDFPAKGPSARSLVVVSPLTPRSGPFRIRLTARPVAAARPPALTDDGPIREPTRCPPRLEPVHEAPVTQPPTERSFHLLIREGDAASPANYARVPARLAAVGRRIQVYVDERDVGRVRPDVLRDVVATFDDRVFPLSARRLGQAADVDRDGRFTVLVTGWLSRLAADGFVRGADFDPDLGEPFGNRCDMMYLGAAIDAGPHLRTVLAHEYHHAVTFTRKLAKAGRAGGSSAEEEGWLDEAMAHLVEDLHGFSRSNLEYRVEAFLAAPERYRLVVEDYFAADLFRSHGNRGSTYLFLRWCADRFGPDLLPSLIGSRERGTRNLEAATGWEFARLFRQWTTSLYFDGLRPDRDGAFGAGCRPETHAGPRAASVRPDGRPHVWEAAGTSPHFVIVEGADEGAVGVEVSGPPEALLQVTAVPLPDDLPAPELSAAVIPDDADRLVLRLSLREHSGRPVDLSSVAWAPLVPGADSRLARSRRGGLDIHELGRAFDRSTLPARGSLASAPIPLAGFDRSDGPIVLRITGCDSRGRRVSAWAEVDPRGSAGGGP